MTGPRVLILPMLLVLVLMLLVACGGADGGQGQTGSTRCSIGEKKACACTDGGTGFKVCKDDERWGSCACDNAPGDDVVGGDDVKGDDTTGGDDAIDDHDLVCHADCVGKQCGPNGCGGVCGTCAAGETCSPGYSCEAGTCTPDCAGKQCGPDGCNGSCGACPSGTICDVNAQCVPGGCQPQCAGRQCGADGCDGTCGTCPAGSQCDVELGTCHTVCQPSCAGKQCGNNGCGGSCGSCSSGSACQSGQCVGSTQIDCLQIYTECFPACPEGDQTCMQACYDTLSPTGKSETDAFMGCLSNNGCYDAADFDQCMVASCFGEYLGCFHGDKSCPQVRTCLTGCGSSNTSCWSDCLADGTTDVQVGFYNAADECLSATCCPNDEALCSEPEGQTCIQVGMAPGGDCSWPSIACP